MSEGYLTSGPQRPVRGYLTGPRIWQKIADSPPPREVQVVVEETIETVPPVEGSPLAVDPVAPLIIGPEDEKEGSSPGDHTIPSIETKAEVKTVGLTPRPAVGRVGSGQPEQAVRAGYQWIKVTLTWSNGSLVVAAGVTIDRIWPLLDTVSVLLEIVAPQYRSAGCCRGGDDLGLAIRELLDHLSYGRRTHLVASSPNPAVLQVLAQNVPRGVALAGDFRDVRSRWSQWRLQRLERQLHTAAVIVPQALLSRSRAQYVKHRVRIIVGDGDELTVQDASAET